MIRGDVDEMIGSFVSVNCVANLVQSPYCTGVIMRKKYLAVGTVSLLEE